MSCKKWMIKIWISVAILTTTSCLNVVNEVTNWMQAQSVEDISGKYHLLENDGVKVYLPDVFERCSSVEYQKLLDSLASKENYEFESKRLKGLREMEGDFYIYFDQETRSTYTINTVPYMPITKQDAKYLLGIISMTNERTAQNSDLKFTKITAKYHGSKDQHIFKSIHKVDNTKTRLSSYNSTYIITSNSKTVWIQLTTPFEVDFDMFIQKMIM